MRHEQAAGNAADGWGRVTRTPGVYLVTAGPGIVNLVPALAQAYYANSPLIGITGRTAFAFSDKHAIPDEHPLCIGNAIVSLRFAKPDVILAVGVCFNELLRFGVGETMYPKDLKVIHVDIEPSVIGKNRPMDLGIVGDPKAVLSQLLGVAKQILKKEEIKESAWAKKLAEIKKTFFSGFEKTGDSTAKPIRP